MPHPEALVAIRDADALVQTSLGFETQGLTPLEAAALGAPTIFSDREIADDVAVSPEWRVAGRRVDALADALRQAVAPLHRCAATGGRGVTAVLTVFPTRVMLAVYERALSA